MNCLVAGGLAGGSVADTAAVQLPPRPYPGLRPFDITEWPVFFGRERVVDAMLARLVHQRVVFVHGDSGCGKSSLVRAGLFARLLQGGAGEGWRVAVALPRQAPLWNMADALARLAAGLGETTPPDAAAHEAAVLDWRRALNAGREAPAALAALYARSAGDAPGCLLVDQFEELFQHAHRHGPDEARVLTEVLVAWQADPPANLYLTTTMRSEYLGACARFGRFAEAVNAAQYLLPPMAHADLLRAVREPARLYEGEVTRELAERLIADAGGSQDQLPLMQHALVRLHTLHAAHTAGAGGRWELGLAQFPAEGGCAGLLSDHADEVRAAVESAGLPRERLVEDLFRSLTDTNADGHAIRRPQTLQQLADTLAVEPAALAPVVDAFRADGVSFLTPSPQRRLHLGTLVDIGHEALIRCWRVLNDPRDGWLVKEFRAGLVWRSLLVQAESFERDSAHVLAAATTSERERFMSRRNAAWARRYGGGWERVHALMGASIAAREQVQRDQAQAQQRLAERQRLRRTLVGGLLLLALLVTALFFADQRRQREADLRRQTEAALAKARQELDLNVQGLSAISAMRSSLENAERELAEERQRRAALEDQLRRQAAGQPHINAAAAPPRAVQVVPATPPADAPRVFIHVAEASQQAAAQALAQRLATQSLGGQRIAVPSVEVVKATPSRATLRCFEAGDCQRDLKPLLALLEKTLAQPAVTPEDLSGRYGGKAVVRARTYEIWFPPGEIRLR